MHDTSRIPRRWLPLILVAGVVLLATVFIVWIPERSSADESAPLVQTPVVAQASAAAEWLEPRGLNIVDMVGLVPEEHLVGSTINYETGTGVLEYISGTRSGGVVTIHVKVTPRYGPGFTNMGCLSQHAAWDQWLSTTPASSVSIFKDGRNISSQVSYLSYTPAGQVLPATGPQEYLRYTKPPATYINPASSISIPANNGCTIVIHGHHEGLTATFRVQAPQMINIVPLGQQQFSAQSYIGQGASGLIAPLARQMNKFGHRHQKFSLNIPDDADYVLVKFGLTAFDPYAPVGNDANLNLAGSGTYRLDGSALSVDHVSMIGLPLRGQWRDLDQSGSSEYLGYIPWPSRLGAPEYFLPPGFPFDPCMTVGDCPDALLGDLYAHSYPVDVYYYRVDRIPGAALERIPLRAVGRSWSPNGLSVAESDQSEPLGNLPIIPTVSNTGMVYLPNVVNQVPKATPVPTTPPATATPTVVPTAAPPEDATGCPCGWFTADGRMLDFVPAP